MLIEVENEQIELLADKCIYIPRSKCLLLADLHLGKVSHFRKNGIPVPPKSRLENLNRLERVIKNYRPENVIFLGDLFHSSLNNEWQEFGVFIKTLPHLRFTLITGNHDILPPSAYAGLNIKTHQTMIQPPFLFTHEPQPGSTYYNICGHIHPAVKLKGKVKNKLTLPCFIFKKDQAILPAFSSFAGSALVKPEKDDRVFIPAGKEIIEMKK